MSLPVTKIDPHTGELHLVSNQPVEGEILHVVIDRTGRPNRLWRIEVGDRLAMQAFGLTERYLVLHDLDRVGVLPRAGGVVRWFPVEPSTVSHTVDASDDERTITVDLMILSAGVPELERWTIDLTCGEVRRDFLERHSVGTAGASSGVVKPKTLLSQ